MSTTTATMTQHEDAKAIAAEIRAFLDRHPHDGPRLLAEYVGLRYDPDDEVAGNNATLEEENEDLRETINDMEDTIAELKEELLKVSHKPFNPALPA